VEISAHDADTVYVSATRYKLADYRPYLFVTRDGGKTWRSIVGNLPVDEITRVIRVDPVRAGLLFVGTETGAFFSLDDGRHWARMKGGLPVVPIYDLKIKGSDLVAATHGRSFWILDDISPLREYQPAKGQVQLITPRDTIRTRLAWSAGTTYTKRGISYGPAFGIGGATEMVQLADGKKQRRFIDVGENPPNGAIIWYLLPQGFTGPVKLSIADARGQEIRSWASDDTALDAAKRPGTQAGLNRFVWDLKHRGPPKPDASLVERRNRPLAEESDEIAGPTAAPGAYSVVLDAGGKRLQAAFTVLKDPRLKTPQRAFDQQLALLKRLYAALTELNLSVNRLRVLKRQLRDLIKLLAKADAGLLEDAKSVAAMLEAVEGALLDPKRESPRDVLRHAGGLSDELSDLISLVAIADAAPTTQAVQISDEVIARVDAQLAGLDSIVANELKALNSALREAGIEVLGLAGSGFKLEK